MNENIPLVSIIIPCHNSVQYLEQSLGSCLNQTYQNIEILLIENASTDNTLQLCNDYASKYPNKVFVYQSKVGGMEGAARNKGITMAKGVYITFLDDDDELGLESIENLVYHAIKHSADSVYGEYKIFHLNGNVDYPKYDASTLYDEARFIRYLGHAGFLYKTSFLLKNNLLYTEDAPFGGDVVFQILFKLLANKIVIMSNLYPTTYNYYIREDSAVNCKTVDYTKIDIVVANGLDEVNKILNTPEQLKLLCGSFYGTKYQDKMIQKAKFFIFNKLRGIINFSINKSLAANPKYKEEALAYFSMSPNYAKLQSMFPNEVIIEPIVQKQIVAPTPVKKQVLKKTFKWYIKHSIKMLTPPIIIKIAKKILCK